MKRTLAALLIALAPLGGCKSLRSGVDVGHRVLDQPGLPPSKFLGMIGATAGGLVAAPVTVVFLPTYIFPGLGYRSSPQHDLWMPLVFAPSEMSMGFGALVTSAVLLPFVRIHDSEEGGPPQVVLHELEPAPAAAPVPAPLPAPAPAPTPPPAPPRAPEPAAPPEKR